MSCIAVCLEHRFFEFEGKIYDNTVYHRLFWDPYVSVFGNVVIIARVKPIERIDKSFKQVDINEVSFLCLNDYSGKLKSISPIFKNIILLKSFSRKIDGAVIRTPCFMGYFLWLFLLFQKKTYSIEVVGDIKDVAQTLSSSYQKFIRRHFYFYIVKLQCKYASTTSYVTERYLQRRYPNSNTSNMFDWSTIQLQKESILKVPKELPKDKTLIFIYTANFALYKGHEYLLDLLKEFNKSFVEWKLILIGEGKHIGKIQNIVEEYGFQENVIFYGSLPNSDVQKLLEGSHVYITTSLTEGLPRAVIEAISKGLPVIGYNVGGVSEIVENKFLVRPKDNENLLKVLLNLLGDKEEYKAVSKRNLHHAYNYSTEVTGLKRIKSYTVFRDTIEKPAI